MQEDNLFLENKKLNIEEIREKKAVLSSKFTSLICALTNRCNSECIMCDTWRTRWEIPERTYKEVFALLPYLEHVIWLGGEVFLSEYFRELLKETKKYPNLAQRINTNGIFINEEWAEKLVQNNVELIYSIDSSSRETYEKIRKGSRFADLIKSLEIINATKKRYPQKKFDLRMNVVIMRSNYREIEGLLDFAKEYGFSLVQFMPIAGEDTIEHIFSAKHRDEGIMNYLDSMAQRLQEKGRIYGIEVLNSLPSLRAAPAEERTDIEENNAALFCYLPWQQVLIYPDGNVRFGCFCDAPIGNVLENSITEIWNSDKAREYRRRIVSGSYYQICGGRCVEGGISLKLRRIGYGEDCYE